MTTNKKQRDALATARTATTDRHITDDLIANRYAHTRVIARNRARGETPPSSLPFGYATVATTCDRIADHILAITGDNTVSPETARILAQLKDDVETIADRHRATANVTYRGQAPTQAGRKAAA